jgi:hypothetical protein
VAVVVVGVLVLAPFARRLVRPTLFGDDVVRIAQIRNESLGEVLRRPFNEHLAPGHGLLTWVAWELCGRRLVAAPWTFAVSAWLSYGVMLGVLGWAVWRRGGGRAVALGVVAWAGLSWLTIEVMAYHSGSGFVWALAATVGAWALAGPSWRARVGAMVCAAVAPTFSAIGVLAGPAGAVGGWWADESVGSERVAGRRRAGAALAPLAGTLMYLAVAVAAHHGLTVARGLERRVDLGVGLLAAGRAVARVLPWAAVGGRPAWSAPLGWADAVGGAVVVGVVLAVAWRTRQWAWAFAGLVLTGGGYGLTYPFRYEGSSEWLLRVDRYHLFPQVGFALWVAMLGRWAVRRWPGLGGAWSGPLVAAVLVVLQGRQIDQRLRFYEFAEQGRVLAALEELEAVCRVEGITRTQALAALEPIRTSWLHPERHGTTVLAMLGPTVPKSRVPDGAVRERLLETLSGPAREALWGGDGRDAVRAARGGSRGGGSGWVGGGGSGAD